MSVHFIENIVKTSVRVAYYNGGGAINGVSARDICRNLYRIQRKIDSSHSILHIKKELEFLGYLKVLSVNELPEQDRIAAGQLKGSRLLKGAYVDADGLIYVTYATEMWDALKKAKIIKSPKGRPKKLNAYALARLLIPVAEEQRKKTDAAGDNARRFLAYYYTYLPSFLRADECKGVRCAEISILRDIIATPETFKTALKLGLIDGLEDLDGIGEEYKAPYLDGYEEPYIAWRDSTDGIVIDKQELKKKVFFYIHEKKYKKADKFALRLPEADVAFFRTTVVIANCIDYIASGKIYEYPFCDYSAAQLQEMNSGNSDYNVQRVVTDILKLLELSSDKSTASVPLYIKLARCYFFSEEWNAGIESLKDAFNLILKETEKNPSLFSYANVTAGYCQEIINFCPPSKIRNPDLPENFLSIKQARDVLQEAAEKEITSVGQCCRLAALCAADDCPQNASAWLNKAFELNKNDDLTDSVMLLEQKINILTTTQLKQDYKKEKVLEIKYIKGLQLAYIRTNMSRRWWEFESLYHGASINDVEMIKKQYRDVPKSLLGLLKIVDGTYRRRYTGKTINFYFLGSDLNGLPYALFSSNRIMRGKNDVKAFKDRISRKYFYCHVDEKITSDTNNVSWLHFADSAEKERTSQLYIDFSPSKKGRKGQIVRFLRERDELTVIADSFDEYLQMLMDKNYNFIISEEELAKKRKGIIFVT